MATISPSHDLQSPDTRSTTLLVSLPSLSQGTLEQTLQRLSEAFAGRNVVIATPDAAPEELRVTPFKVVGYTPVAVSATSWTLTAADFLNAHELASEHGAAAVLILGPEAQSLQPAALLGLAESVLGNDFDLAVPRYALSPRSGLVNSAILYPVTRAVFGAVPRFPLAIDLCVSARMAERLATIAQKFTAANQPDALIWPVPEAASAGYTIAQVDAGPRALPQPVAPDLNILLAQIAGSLFAEVDARAAFWQRSRVAPPSRPSERAGEFPEISRDELHAMVESFRLAYVNLSEIWSLVLPPQSLFGLKRLSTVSVETFSMPDSLWARIVYDFLLAYRLRTINRGHLLGAFTPLYLAWVASYLLQMANGKNAEAQIEALAAAFEADKPYLVSRWRWPDRFNP